MSNLLVAGRCHSATRGAHASIRVTATAMAMGEAAGLAAAGGLGPNEVAADKLRDALRRQGGGPFTTP